MTVTRVADWRLEIHDTLPSTSDFVIGRAEAGEAAGLAVLARRQTQGRGSRGRRWAEAPEGNLALSVLLRPSPPLDVPGLWPFLSGLALIEALDAPALTLKWPNDVMLHGRKLAGILIERQVGGADDWLVIGFGANLAQAPVLDRPVASLAELGAPPDPALVAERLLLALDAWQTRWRDGGFAAVRSAWLARAHPLGTPIAVGGQGGATSRSGRFAGIADDGALLLVREGREERIATGDVLLLTGS